MNARPRGLLVTGLSGAGKTVITRCFEDLGYTCVDNLLLDLIEPLFTRVWAAEHGAPWVVVVDVRTPDFASSFPAIMTALKQRFAGLQLLFVEASTESIVRRFSETRRPHPFRELPLEQAVSAERRMLEAVRALADDVLDTSDLTPHELRSEVAARFGTTAQALPMVVRCESFGFRYGLPPDANLVFDLRFLPNPHFVPDLRALPGDDPAVVRWLEAQPEVEASFARFRDLCDTLLPAYRREHKSYLVIAFGCTGGRHRSVYMAQRLAAHLASGGWVVSVLHRDRDRAP
jgi:RNase adapter protein RapZ